MWLSLICTKLSSPMASFGLNPGSRLRLYDFSTPPLITQRAPVPAQAMHFKNPRRSIPSSLRSCRISSLLLPVIFSSPTSEDTSIRNYLLPPVPANFLGRAARVRESREPAPHMGRVSFVQTTRVRQLFPVWSLTNLLPYSSHQRGT